MANISIKHHFIPQFILRRFCDTNGKLNSYDKKFNKFEIKTPSQVCYEKNLYSIINANEFGRYLNVEGYFSKMEGEFSKVIKLFDDDDVLRYMKYDTHSLNSFERIVNFFLTTSYWRIPSEVNFDHINKTKENFRNIYNDLSDNAKEITGLIDRRTMKYIEKEKNKNWQKIVPTLIIPTFLSYTTNDDLKKCAFHKTDYDLITSDNPIICDINQDCSLGGDIYIPVGNRLCITNNIDKIDYFQKSVFRNARKFVIASSKELLLEVGNSIDNSSASDALQ